MIHCIAIDDEPLALEVIVALCKNMPFLHLERTFTNPSEAHRYLLQHHIDLVFLDIQMPTSNGVELAKQLHQDTMVIFTTAFTEYAVQGFEVNAIDYVLKPIQLKRFEQACLKAKGYFEFLQQRNPAMENALYVRSEYAVVKISLASILYIETMDDYVKIHQIGKTPIITLMSMKKMQEKLPVHEFIRIHRSYIVPLHKIEAVRAKSVFLGVLELPIGASYEEDFFKVYTRNFK